MAYIMENLHYSEDSPKIMSLRLLNEITNNFSHEWKLGTGTYGEVYKGIQNGEEIAVKRLRLLPGVDDLEQFKKEFENLWKLRHRNIVRLLGYCYEISREFIEFRGELVPVENISRALCFEYMHNGSLQNHLYDEYHGLNWQTRYRIIKGTCEGLKYLHEGLESPIYHLDLKPDNILLDKNMEPKLADFGLSKLVRNEQTQATQSIVGTIGYMPPEYIEENLVSKKLDIFSLGVIMIRIMTGYEGYHKKAQMSPQGFIELVHNNWRNRLKETQDCSSLEYECNQVKRCIEIALDCVKSDRNQRPNIGTIVQLLNETEHKNQVFKDWSTKDDSNLTSNFSVTSVNPQSGQCSPNSKGKVYNFHFYMHQTINGPNHNQVNIADPKQPRLFGYTNVHDYPIYDSFGSSAKIVARAQGLHTETSMNYNDWFHWSSIVFFDERFQQSSFVAIGNITHEGEWAIIGGTGAFSFARGTISISRIQNDESSSSNIKEIHIHALCCTPKTISMETNKSCNKDGLTKDYIIVAPNVGSPSMSNLTCGPMTALSQGTEYSLNLYMHQIIDGTNRNQVNIADPNHPQMFGHTNVHDYPIYDSPGPNAKIIARAQGLHAETSMNYNDWFHWSNIVFCDERLQGSSIVAIGNLTHKGEWAIVGGTGVFTFSQGTISIHKIQQIGTSNIKDIHISAFCCTPRTISTKIKTLMYGSIKHDSDATLCDGSHSMGKPQSDQDIPQFQRTEYNLKLYMHQIIHGPNRNQVNIADPKQPMMFGYTNVHDYPMYDSLDDNAKIVARVQGLHTETSMNYNDWFHWSSIVFSDERFRGSSFVAIGNITHEGEWAIVGGTGVFTFTQGIISISRIQHNDSSNIKEIRICALCHAHR